MILIKITGASEEKQPVPEHQETTTAAPVPAPALAVRFASATEEIEPPKSLEPADDSNPEPRSSTEEDENLKEIKKLHGSQLQGRRASAYAFEVMSLPASRVRTFVFRLMFRFGFDQRYLHRWRMNNERQVSRGDVKL